MGLLDDAIREHLDLKRRRGADPAEIERAEHEALGPVRRDSLTASMTIDDRSPDFTANAEPHRLTIDEPRQAHRRRGLLRRRHAPEPDFYADLVPSSPDVPDEELGEDSLSSIDAREPEATSPHLVPEEHEAPDPAGGAAPASATPPPVAAPGSSPPAPDDPRETAEYDIEAAFAAPAEPTAGDVLEETPEFLQDTPEHDRLWFEQRPPKDFDFDG